MGRWAFANSLTNNAQAWGDDVKGVGLYYAMQGREGRLDRRRQVQPADRRRHRTHRPAGIDRRRHGDGGQVRPPGFAQYLTDNGYVTAFVDTLKMERTTAAGCMIAPTAGW